MTTPKSEETINALFAAINQGDLDGALDFYETGAKMITESGSIAKGKDAIRIILKEFLSFHPVIAVQAERMIEADDITVYCFRCALTGKCDKSKHRQVEGISISVLRKQADGNYRISIDSPWGASILIQ